MSVKTNCFLVTIEKNPHLCYINRIALKKTKLENDWPLCQYCLPKKDLNYNWPSFPLALCKACQTCKRCCQELGWISRSPINCTIWISNFRHLGSYTALFRKQGFLMDLKRGKTVPSSSRTFLQCKGSGEKKDAKAVTPLLQSRHIQCIGKSHWHDVWLTPAGSADCAQPHSIWLKDTAKQQPWVIPSSQTTKN